LALVAGRAKSKVTVKIAGHLRFVCSEQISRATGQIGVHPSAIRVMQERAAKAFDILWMNPLH